MLTKIVQQKYSYLASLVDGVFSSESNITCFTKKYTEHGILITNSIPLIPTTNTIIDNHFDIEKILKCLSIAIKIPMQNQLQKINYYYICNNEKLVFNQNKADERYYECFRVVIVDSYNESYVEEIANPNYHSNLSSLIAQIQDFVDQTNSYLMNKTRFVSTLSKTCFPVIYTPHVSGFFIHEVIGHLLEDDIYKIYGKNILQNCIIDKRLTVVNDSNHFFALGQLGKLDDLGNAVKSSTLIKSGRILNTLSDLSGSMRSECFEKAPMPRMHCTFICPASSGSWKDFIHYYKNCVLVTHAYSGECDIIQGNYTLYGQGQLFNNGNLIGSIGELCIHSPISDHLSQIDYIGNDLKFFPSECSKLGNIIRVGIGGPSISFKKGYISGRLYK